MTTDDLLIRIRRAARSLRDVADPAAGDYDLDEALGCACDLAEDLTALDRALSVGVTLPPAWTKNRRACRRRLTPPLPAAAAQEAATWPPIPIDSIIAAPDGWDAVAADAAERRQLAVDHLRRGGLH